VAADTSDVFASDSATSYSKVHLPKGEGDKERIISCMVNYWHARRLQIIASENIAPGSAVSVEHEDVLLIGEVVSSAPQAHLWRTDIEVEHALNGLMNLMALRSKLLEESPARSEARIPARLEVSPR
jgi:hypothetical protein